MPFFWKPFHKPPQKFENRAMGAFWEICISVPWIVTLLSGAASFIFANRINVMFLTGGQGNTMQNKHCTEMRNERWEMRNEKWKRNVIHLQKIYDYLKEGDIFRWRGHTCLLLKWYIFVVPNFLLFSTMHCNLASYEVLSWFLSIPWDYKTYTAKVLILICKVEEFVAGIEILETLRLVYTI